MIYKTVPYKHQFTAYNKAYHKKYFALFMEMGVGKTKVSVDLAGNYYNEGAIDAVMVVAPNSVHRQWAEEEIPKHCPVDYATLTWSATKNKTQRYQREKSKFMKSDKLKFFCVNIETFSSKNYLGIMESYLKNNRCLMIIDESTTIKSHDANRTINILKLSELPVAKLILTGTPVTNSPFDLWGQFEFLHKNFFGCSYFVFKHRYGILIKEERENSLGKSYDCTRVMRLWEIKKAKGQLKKLQTDHYKKDEDGDEILVEAVSLDLAEEMLTLTTGISEKDLHYIATHDIIKHPYKSLARIKKRIDPYTYTVKKEDCLDLPSKIFSPIHVEMSKEQRRVYKDTKEKMMAMYADRDLTVMNKLSLMLRLQQITGGFFPHDPTEYGVKPEPILIGKNTVKFNRLVQDLEEVREDEKIIIWCKFTAEIKYLRIILSKMYPDDRVETYYGGTPKTKGYNKDTIKRDFKKGDIKILIANKQSAGIGLNLQISSLHYTYSGDFSLERELQAQDRSHRIGQTRHVVYKNIIVINSIDEKIDMAISQKKDLLEYFREKSLKQLLDEGDKLF